MNAIYYLGTNLILHPDILIVLEQGKDTVNISEHKPQLYLSKCIDIKTTGIWITELFSISQHLVW